MFFFLHCSSELKDFNLHGFISFFLIRSNRLRLFPKVSVSPVNLLFICLRTFYYHSMFVFYFLFHVHPHLKALTLFYYLVLVDTFSYSISFLLKWSIISFLLLNLWSLSRLNLFRTVSSDTTRFIFHIWDNIVSFLVLWYGLLPVHLRLSVFFLSLGTIICLWR